MMKKHPVILAALLAALAHLGAGQSRIFVGSLPTFAHGVRGNLHVETTTRLVITDFDYDGQGPDTFVYYFRPGDTVTGHGGGVIVPLLPPEGVGDEGMFRVGRRFENEVLIIDLPSGTTLCDIGTIAIWCRRATQLFTAHRIPNSLFANGRRATSGECVLDADAILTTIPPDPDSYGNCEPLGPALMLQWNVRGDRVDYRICGCSPTNRQNEYMGFGLSSNPNRTDMIGADVTIAWAQISDGSARAVDYYLSARSLCVDGEGVCPDTEVAGRSCSNNIAAIEGGVDSTRQCVKFTKDLTANDECDLSVADNSTVQYIVWAIGRLGDTARYHSTRSDSTTPPLSLQRPPLNNCTGFSLTCDRCPNFEGKKMSYPQDTTFRLTIGPPGLERGYSAITGRAGWGFAWYVNGTLIPELILTRGSTYTFIIEGGNDPSNLARYHPFYITNSPDGGGLRREISGEEVYAGVDSDNNPTPGAVGRFCEYNETEAAALVRSTCGSFDDYLDLLSFSCDSGEPGKIVWTPDETTPSTVYYQCGTHAGLGWRITISGSPSSAVASLTTILALVLAVLNFQA